MSGKYNIYFPSTTSVKAMEADNKEQKTTTRKENLDEKILSVRTREMTFRLVEIYIWALVSILISGGIFFDIFIGESPFLVISQRYIEFLFAFFTFLFPIVFRLIFGALPLESLRRTRTLMRYESPTNFTEPKRTTAVQEAEIKILSDELSTDELSLSSATKLFAYYANSSRKLSQSIYNRAGVYLLVGVIVSFSGLVFFYLQTTQISKDSTDGIAVLITLAPKFGILFFVEFVAFFFLRQYRSIMDEFRYYEAIKRNREETLALIQIASDSDTPLDPITLVKSEAFFSKAGVLAKGQTSEIIESRKLEKGEIDLLEKVIEILSRSKK